MSDNINEILTEIDSLRRNLNKVVNEKGTIDSEVIAASQIVDAALNEYYKLLVRKNGS